MDIRRVSLALFLVTVSALSAAEVPVTFQAGTPASAAEVNANFSNLDNRLELSLGGIIISSYVASASSVASATCPSDTLIVSANCSCEGDGATVNYGVLFGCNVAGNGGFVGCFPEAATYSPFRADPTATVVVVCGGAVRNNGTTILPVSLSIAKAGTMPAAQQSVVDPVDARTAMDELEVAIKKVSDQIQDYKAVLLEKSQP